MLQINVIRDHKNEVIKGLKKRNIKDAEEKINKVIELDSLRRKTQQERDDLLAEGNKISKQIGELMKSGKREEAEKVKEKSATLKTQSKELGDQLVIYEDELQKLLYTIPNAANENVPAGSTAEDNETVYQHGEIPKLGNNKLPHWELIKKYDIIDFDLGNKITGAGFPVYKGKGARLQRALINYFLDSALDKGYLEIQPPIVINEDSGFGTGQLPDKDGQMYFITEDKLYLIPTAEVPITNIYRDVILDEADLPVKNVGYTPCFRREAGSWGAHVRGLNRLHQFDKVEIVHITHPEKSYEALEEMKNYIQGLLESLNLPYRVLNLCGGDLGFTAAQTFDMEVYSAAQEKWLEVSSASNFETYQSNRLKLRFRDGNKKIQLAHTLNGSALALPRILAAILENNQTEDGILVPEVLKPYTGFDIID
ncbi:MAG: serine--tRNA ligase [Candidatus Cyclobacteriaceae bacterium M2_1C_046]